MRRGTVRVSTVVRNRPLSAGRLHAPPAGSRSPPCGYEVRRDRFARERAEGAAAAPTAGGTSSDRPNGNGVTRLTSPTCRRLTRTEV